MQKTLVTLVALYHAKLLGQLHATATVHLDAATTEKGSQKNPNKSLAFVNIIKEDLRRNNDDYAVFEHNLFLETTKAPPPVPQPAISSRQPNGIPVGQLPPAGRGDARRPVPLVRRPEQVAARPDPPLARPAPATGARPAPLVHQQPGHALPRKPLGAPPYRMQRARLPLHVPINTRRGVNMTFDKDTFLPGHMHKPPNATQFRSYTHSKHYKKVRVDKLKRLVDKERNRMRDHGGRAGPDTLNEALALPAEKAIEGGDETGTMPTTPGIQPEPTGASATFPTATETTQTTPSLSQMLATTDRSHQVKKVSGHQPGAKLRHYEEQRTQSPSPDQLDMAPARGPSIALIRFKGRLCQRSMLNMEGPTYGKDGSMVMGAYKPSRKRGRPFNHTTPANPLLPRCCNCCKKSVLGCQ